MADAETHRLDPNVTDLLFREIINHLGRARSDAELDLRAVRKTECDERSTVRDIHTADAPVEQPARYVIRRDLARRLFVTRGC